MTLPRWGLLGGLAALFLVALFLVLPVLNYQHRQLLSARQDAEAARLEVAHQIVEKEESRKALALDAEQLTRANDQLREALTIAMQAAPGAVASTAEELLSQPGKPTQRRQHQLSPASSSPSNSVAPAVPTTGHFTTQPACALAQEDDAWFKVDLITLQTREKNTVVVGTAELWRGGPSAMPPGERVLGPLRFQSEVSHAETVASPSPLRWGLALEGLCGGSGCAPGVGVLFPPWEVFGARLEGSAALYAGAPGAFARAGLGVRW